MPGSRPTTFRAGSALAAAVAAAAAAAVLGLLAGCQSQSAINREPHAGATTAAAGQAVQTVTLTVDSSYRFMPATITVHPGRVKIVLEHTGSSGAPHDWQLSGFPADYVPLTQPGQTRSIEFTTPAPGSYQFVCTIHVTQGQTGTLVVLAQ